MIKKILIANRGEIAVRIVRACAEMGIRSVAVYSDADRHALHVKRADEAHSIGEDPLAGYLNPRKLVNLAVETGCDALHPGYGFLSENAELADICAERGIKFIGPAAEVIRRMGDKTEARRSMIKAGVPVTPGTDGNVADIHEALLEGERIGYPVMVIYPLATVLLGLLLMHQKERNELLMKTSEMEVQYRNFFLNNHAIMMLVDPQTGNIIETNQSASPAFVSNYFTNKTGISQT